MSFLAALLCLFTSLAPVQGETPSPEAVQRTLAELADAAARSEADESPRAHVQALQRAADVPAPEVVARVAEDVRHSNPTIVRAALAALGALQHADALKALERAHKQVRSIQKDPELQGVCLRSMAQHGDPRTIPLLVKNAFDRPSYESVQARIFGLARIRDPRSVEALIDLIAKTSPKETRRYTSHFRLSLVVLTGTDQGGTLSRWVDWWKSNKRSFRMPAEMPRLPRNMRRQWNAYWGNTMTEERPERREDRGNDAPGIQPGDCNAR